MKREEITHTIGTRAAHWFNVVLVGALIWTGFSMFAGDRDFVQVVRLLPAMLWHTIRLPGTKRQPFLHWVLGGGSLRPAVNGATIHCARLPTVCRSDPRTHLYFSAPRSWFSFSSRRTSLRCFAGGTTLRSMTVGTLMSKSAAPVRLTAENKLPRKRDEDAIPVLDLSSG
jgi:hypothetical protein